MKQMFTLALLSAVAGVATAAVPAQRAQLPVKGATAVKVSQVSPTRSDVDLPQLPIIEDLPDGVECADYSRDSFYYALDGQGKMYTMADYGMVSEVAVTDDAVYILNPFGGTVTNSWIKGDREGDKVTFTFPQHVLKEVYPDWDKDPDGSLGLMIEDNYYAYKFILKDNGTTSSFVIDYDDPSITFTLRDGALVQEGDNYIGMVGQYRMLDDKGEEYIGFNWMGYADGYLTFNPVTDVVAEAPADADFQVWLMKSGGEEKVVEIAVDGSDFWLRGFTEMLPWWDSDGDEPAIKGTLADGKVSFAKGQYLGVDYNYGHFAYFIPCTYSYDAAHEQNVYNSIESIDFAYDPEAGTLTAPEGEALVVSTISDGIFMIVNIDSPVFTMQDNKTPMTPCDPTDLMYDYFDDYEYGVLAFQLSDRSTDGRIMNTSNLCYSIFIDDEIMTFYPDEYWSFEEPVTEIGYDFWCEEIDCYGEDHQVLIFPTGFDRIGVRAKYVNADGSETYSKVVYIGEESAVNRVQTSAEVVASEWYDLAGRRLTCAPADGIAIRRDLCKDGTVRVTKHLSQK